MAPESPRSQYYVLCILLTSVTELENLPLNFIFKHVRQCNAWLLGEVALEFLAAIGEFWWYGVVELQVDVACNGCSVVESCGSSEAGFKGERSGESWVAESCVVVDCVDADFVCSAFEVCALVAGNVLPFVRAHDVKYVLWCNVVFFLFWFSLYVVKVFWMVFFFFADGNDVFRWFCSVCNDVAFKVCGEDESV